MIRTFPRINSGDPVRPEAHLPDPHPPGRPQRYPMPPQGLARPGPLIDAGLQPRSALEGKGKGRQVGTLDPAWLFLSAGWEGGLGEGQGPQIPGPPPRRPSNQGKGKTFFERHPKKTLAVLVVLAVLALALIADRLLALKVTPPRAGVERFVRLRELSPGAFEAVNPKPRVFDAQAGFPPREVVIRVDEEGFVRPSRVHAHPDLVLAFLGGSTSECRAVPEDHRFPYLVGRCLETALNTPVNSYNAARSGNNSLHSLNILLHKLLPLNPDIVVMMHNINDLVALLYEKTYWNQNPSRRVMVELRPTLVGHVRGFFQIIREHTIPHLYAALKGLGERGGAEQQIDEFRHLRGRNVEINRDLVLREFRSNLQMFIDMCRARGIAPVLMTQANRFQANLDPETWREVQVLEAQGISYGDFRDLYSSFNQAIRDQGAARQVLVIDLARDIPPEPKFIHDPVHFTERGSKLAAEVICTQLKPLAAARLQHRGAQTSAPEPPRRP